MAESLQYEDYRWLLEAAGQDRKRLALLAVLLAAHSLMLSQVVDESNHQRVVEELLILRRLMQEIATAAQIPQSEVNNIVRDTWGVSGSG